MIRRLAYISVVMVTLFATAAPCFCWVRMLSHSSCHAMGMKDCCCSKKAALNDDASRSDAALLPNGWHPSERPIFVPVFVSHTIDFSSQVLSKRRTDPGGPLRSPPDLFLRHASLLI